jgi:hypothetical protein
LYDTHTLSKNPPIIQTIKLKDFKEIGIAVTEEVTAKTAGTRAAAVGAEETTTTIIRVVTVVVVEEEIVLTIRVTMEDTTIMITEITAAVAIMVNITATVINIKIEIIISKMILNGRTTVTFKIVYSSCS